MAAGRAGAGMHRRPSPDTREGTMRRLLIVLFGSLLVVLFGSFGVVGALGFAPAVPLEALIQGTTKLTRADPNSRFAGTWRLARIERLGPKGELLPAPAAPAFGSPNPVGVLMSEPAGYMGLT